MGGPAGIAPASPLAPVASSDMYSTQLLRFVHFDLGVQVFRKISVALCDGLISFLLQRLRVYPCCIRSFQEEIGVCFELIMLRLIPVFDENIAHDRILKLLDGRKLDLAVFVQRIDVVLCHFHQHRRKSCVIRQIIHGLLIMFQEILIILEAHVIDAGIRHIADQFDELLCIPVFGGLHLPFLVLQHLGVVHGDGVRLRPAVLFPIVHLFPAGHGMGAQLFFRIEFLQAGLGVCLDLLHGSLVLPHPLFGLVGLALKVQSGLELRIEALFHLHRRGRKDPGLPFGRSLFCLRFRGSCLFYGGCHNGRRNRGSSLLLVLLLHR